MEHYLSRALIGRIKCPRYFFLNVPEKRFRADRGGLEGRDEIRLEGRDGVRLEGRDGMSVEGRDEFGKEG